MPGLAATVDLSAHDPLATAKVKPTHVDDARHAEQQSCAVATVLVEAVVPPTSSPMRKEHLLPGLGGLGPLPLVAYGAHTHAGLFFHCVVV